MAKKSAMAKDPPKRTEASKAPSKPPAPPPAVTAAPTQTKVVEAPTRAENKAIFDSMTPEQQQRYTRLRANKGLEAANKYMSQTTGKTPTGPGGRARTAEEKAGQVPPQGTPAAPAGSPEETFRSMSPAQQEREMYSDAGAFYNNIMNNAMKFDPNNPGAGYQQGFTNQLESARQNVMDQFERTMGPQFQREQADFQQRMAEQGIDPNSGAYQAQYKAMMDSQNAQRMNAQSEAFKLGAGYQQQGFEQAITGQKLPFEQWTAAQDPWRLQYGARMEAIQKEKDRQAALQQSRMSAGASVRGAQISADAAKYQANLNAINQGYGQQQPQENWQNALIAGGVAGATNAVLK